MIFSEKFTLTNLIQLLKAEHPIFFTVWEKFMLVKLVQPENASISISSTPIGIL